MSTKWISEEEIAKQLHYCELIKQWNAEHLDHQPLAYTQTYGCPLVRV